MDINELTQKMNTFVTAKGWYDPSTPKPQTARNLAISMSLEASEVLEHFQWHESDTNPNSLPGELADVALYLLQLASVTNIDLEKAIIDKLALNYERDWPEEAKS